MAVSFIRPSSTGNYADLSDPPEVLQLLTLVHPQASHSLATVMIGYSTVHTNFLAAMIMLRLRCNEKIVFEGENGICIREVCEYWKNNKTKLTMAISKVVLNP